MSNPRNDKHLDQRYADAELLLHLGEAPHSRYVLKKDGLSFTDIDLIRDNCAVAEIFYVCDRRDVTWVYAKFHVPATPRQVQVLFPNFSMKVATSPCDSCKIKDRGAIYYPGDILNVVDWDEEENIYLGNKY